MWRLPGGFSLTREALSVTKRTNDGKTGPMDGVTGAVTEAGGRTSDYLKI